MSLQRPSAPPPHPSLFLLHTHRQARTDTFCLFFQNSHLQYNAVNCSLPVQPCALVTDAKTEIFLFQGVHSHLEDQSAIRYHSENPRRGVTEKDRDAHEGPFLKIYYLKGRLTGSGDGRTTHLATFLYDGLNTRG